MHLLTILAAETAPNVSLLQDGWAQVGAFALIIAGLIWFVRYQLKSMEASNKEDKARAQRFEDDNRRLYGFMTDQMVPALTKASNAVTEATSMIQDSQRDRERDRIRAEAKAELTREQSEARAINAKERSDANRLENK